MIYKLMAFNAPADPEGLKKTDALGRAIVKLAAQENEEIFFHNFTDDLLGGAPVILLECSDDLFDMVADLPECADAEEYTWPHSTDRNQDIYNFYKGPSPFTPSAPFPGMPKP